MNIHLYTPKYIHFSVVTAVNQLHRIPKNMMNYLKIRYHPYKSQEVCVCEGALGVPYLFSCHGPCHVAMPRHRATSPLNVTKNVTNKTDVATFRRCRIFHGNVTDVFYHGPGRVLGCAANGTAGNARRGQKIGQ